MHRHPPPSTRVALATIRGYQRWISPHKGFCCALRSATGGASCSAYGYQVIARFGLGRGLGLLQRRLTLCGHLHRQTRPAPRPVHPRRRREQGFCDPGCDVPACDLACEGLQCCDIVTCDCDRDRLRRCWPFADGRQRNTEHLDALARRIRERQRRARDNASDPATPAEVMDSGSEHIT